MSRTEAYKMPGEQQKLEFKGDLYQSYNDYSEEEKALLDAEITQARRERKQLSRSQHRFEMLRRAYEEKAIRA